mgnify:CR=1 FL=1
MQPSRAAIILPGISLTEAEEVLTNALKSRRYNRVKTPPPRGYPTYLGEWLGFAVYTDTNNSLTVVVPHDVSQVFTVALWIAEASPSLVFCAWRKLQALPPVLKYYAQGRPQFRDGPDRDLEVTWSIPTHLPANIASPEDMKLPATAHEVDALLGGVLNSYQTLTQEPGLDLRTIGFLDRKSPLA